jgi:division protein 1
MTVISISCTHAIHQTLSGHHGPINAIDFSEPYGTLVSSSTAHDEGGGVRVWDLSSGEELGHLVSPGGTHEVVKCLQVNNATCITGGTDAQLRLWDLGRVGNEFLTASSDKVDDEDSGNSSILYSRHVDNDSGSRDTLMNTFRGHAQTVSALYSEEACLVSCMASARSRVLRTL